MGIHIRKAQAKDGPGIARVRVLAWKIAYRSLLPDELLDTMDIQEEGAIWRSRLESLPAERSLLIAEANEPLGTAQQTGVVGFCASGPEREMDMVYTAEIYALYVLPDCQGIGIGRALVRTASTWLYQEGYKQMIIYVLRDNHAARGFYEAIGGALARERMWDIQGTKVPEVGYGFHLGDQGVLTPSI